MFITKQYTPQLGDLGTYIGSDNTGLYCLDIQNQELALRIYDTLISSGYIEQSLYNDAFMDWNNPLIHNRQKVFTVAPGTKKFKVRVLISQELAIKFNNLYFPLYDDSFFDNWDFKFVMVEKSRYICK